jgi:hypothetical protein
MVGNNRPAGVKPSMGAGQMPTPTAPPMRTLYPQAPTGQISVPRMSTQPVAPDKRAIMAAAMRMGK